MLRKSMAKKMKQKSNQKPSCAPFAPTFNILPFVLNRFKWRSMESISFLSSFACGLWPVVKNEFCV